MTYVGSGANGCSGFLEKQEAEQLEQAIEPPVKILPLKKKKKKTSLSYSATLEAASILIYFFSFCV